MYIWQIKMLVGILNGIFQKVDNLQYIEKVNIMVGIVILGITFIKKKDQQKVKIENYQ